MHELTKLYPSVRCNSDVMAELAINAPAESSVFCKYYGKRFLLIEGIVVGATFLDELAEHPIPWDLIFDHGMAISARELVGEWYWAGLSAEHRTVLGACLLILIEQGRVVLKFPEREQKAA